MLHTISTYETPNSECSGLPSTFKAFLKYPCGDDNLSGSTEYFACPGEGTETASVLIYLYVVIFSTTFKPYFCSSFQPLVIS